MLDTTQDLIDAGCASGDKLSADLALALNDAQCDINAKDAEIDRLTRELAQLRQERTAAAFTSANATLDTLAASLGHDNFDDEHFFSGPPRHLIGAAECLDEQAWTETLRTIDQLTAGPYEQGSDGRPAVSL